ncbi:hypothetical protein GCM10020255_008850 [Rhodococcus baikonurensis]
MWRFRGATGHQKSRCGTSSTSDRSPAALAGTSELKASGPITAPTKAGTTTQTSPFGPRWGTEHKGVDFAGPVGTPIYAALDGIAVKAGPSGEGPGVGFENWIVIDSLVDDQPVSTVYGHMFTDGVLITPANRSKPVTISPTSATPADPPALTCTSNTGKEDGCKADSR